MDINRQHFSISAEASSGTVEVAAPIMKLLGLNYFAYRRIYDDGRHVTLSTSPEWLVKYYHNEYYRKKETQKHKTEECTMKPVILDFVKKDSFSTKALKDSESFNFHHSLSLLDIKDNYVELFSFAAPKEINPSEKYLTYFSYIKKFTKYFKNQALELIIKAEKTPFLTDQTCFPNTAACDVEDQFFKEIFIKKLKIRSGNSCITLTSRETECAFLLLEAKTSKEIGKLLNLSSRTVEAYINNIKIKTNSPNKSALIKNLYLCSNDELRSQQ